jgi:hypothetical protein
VLAQARLDLGGLREQTDNPTHLCTKSTYDLTAF